MGYEADNRREHEADRDVHRQRSRDSLGGDAPLAQKSKDSLHDHDGNGRRDDRVRGIGEPPGAVPVATRPIRTIVATPTISALR